MNVPFIVFPIFLDQWGKRMEISFKIFSGGLVLKDKKITKLEINTSFFLSLNFILGYNILNKNLDMLLSDHKVSSDPGQCYICEGLWSLSCFLSRYLTS